jgi:dihydroxy-acid dehydratase
LSASGGRKNAAPHGDEILRPRSGPPLLPPAGSNIRALYKAMGYSDYDLARPLIGVANSWNSANPGHSNLNQIAERVCQAGGTPVEFGIIGPCDDRL